jgi:hypothetical protein
MIAGLLLKQSSPIGLVHFRTVTCRKESNQKEECAKPRTGRESAHNKYCLIKDLYKKHCPVNGFGLNLQPLILNLRDFFSRTIRVKLSFWNERIIDHCIA